MSELNLNEEINIAVRPKKVRGMKPNEILTYTEEARLCMAADMTKDGVPQGRDRRLFLELLTSIDTSVMDRQRLDLEEQGINNDQDIARQAIAILDKKNKLAERLVREGKAIIRTSEGIPDVDTSDLPEVTYDAEEFNNEVVENNFENFNQQHDVKGQADSEA